MNTALDQSLIAELNPYLEADYEKLRYARQAGLKNAFLSGELVDVDLTYTEPSHIDYPRVWTDLEIIGQSINEAVPVVRRSYLPKLQEIKNKYSLFNAVANRDDQAVMNYSQLLYGLPKLQYYQYAIRELRNVIHFIQTLELPDRRVAQAMNTLAGVGGDISASTDFDEIELPMLDIYQNTDVMSAVDIKQTCEEAFAHYGIEDWTAVIAKPGERITFNTDQECKTVHIPHDADSALRKYPLTSVRVKALIAHEIGTHVVRRENGQKSPLALLGAGLAGYLPGEEGIATYREQRAHGASQFAGVMCYLAVSWAVGLDGKPRTFRELYELMVPYIFLSVIEQVTLANLPLNLDIIKENAERNAWARCIRTFRGTTGKTPGCCFTRDIIYLEGNVRIWQLLKLDATWENKFCLGKYDPANPEHVAILCELGLMT